ncbi:LCP family protein [Cohnella lubricantis]|uniref:LCP family protein n=1 Tax=Cohnella lubricantis TaxID=2163172 RepID=A0A841TJD5_9BACL|nr:LCP family protein [Cohnella lubricantis]MBB6679037.1 LCP family protein [Cohnella lubricantis]MBP2120242.1 LCP family protein required for cell wall assembly [Cohnella lubricantis]
MTALKPGRRKWRLALLIASSTLGTLVLILGIFAGFLVYKADHTISKIAAPAAPATTASASPSASLPEVTASGSEAPDDSERPITFLLAGIDNREGSGGTLNTDVLMLAALNPKTHAASLLSLPRDLQVKPETISTHKANYYYAYFYNQDKESAMASTKQMYSDLLHFPIDHMVMINFDGLRKLVDALGGVTVDVDMDMRYRDDADGTDIDLKQGVQTLDGDQTLDFVRYRKSNEGTQQSSDIARNARQQQVLSQIADKLATFQGITQWYNVLDIVGDNVKTDIPENLLRDWMSDYKAMKPDQIQMLPLETHWDSPYIYANEDSLREALNTLRTEAELPPSEMADLPDVIGTYETPDEEASNESAP